MKTLKRIIICITIMLAMSMPTYATDIDQSNEQSYKELLEQSGALELDIPENAKGLISTLDIDLNTTDSLLNVSFFDFIGGIGNEVKRVATMPITILLASIAAMLLCSLLNSLKTSFANSSYEKTFSAVSVICICATIITPVASLLTSCTGVIKGAGKFMLSFVPIYSGIIASSGKPILAATYQLSVVGVIQLIAEISATIIVPLLSIYLAFCLIGSTSSQINVGGIAKGVKTTATVILTFLLTVFVGLLTIQGIVAGSADTLTLKTAKFALSTFLPVVGSAMSEALNSVQGCIGLMKSSVGGFSIFVIIATFLPSVISIVLMQLSLFIAASIGDLLDTTQISALMRSVSSVLSILLGIVLTFFAMMTISIGIMLTIGG